MAYEQVEPFGDRRGDIQAALICTVLANLWRDEKQQPYTLKNFLLEFEQVRAEQTMEEQIAFARMLTIALGGKDLRGKRNHEHVAETASGPGT